AEQPSKGSRGCDQEPADHRERNHQFAQACGKIAKECTPAGASGVDQAFAANQFAPNSAYDRADEQTGQSKKQANKRADDRAPCSPTGRTKALSPKPATKKIDSEGDEH